jgi:hypothetical protein
MILVHKKTGRLPRIGEVLQNARYSGPATAVLAGWNPNTTAISVWLDPADVGDVSKISTWPEFCFDLEWVESVQPAPLLPTHEECLLACERGGETALHRFILDNEPDGIDDIAWRRQLADALNHVAGENRYAYD